MGLFRREAIDAQRDRLQGEVVLLPRWPHTLVCGFLLLWVIAALALLNQASYSRKETVRGWLEPADGLVQVFAQSEGRLARLLVAPGDTVIAGQPLAVINGDRVLEDGVHLETLLLHEYQQQRASLERQIAREAELAVLRRTELRDTLADIRSALDAISRQRQTMSDRMALVEKRLERHRQLAAKGHLTQAELDTLLERALLLEGEQQALETTRLEQEARESAAKAELARLPQDTDNTVDRLRLTLSDLSQDIARLRGNRAYVVQAPVAGTVSRISLQPGQRARYNQALATLLPSGSPLVAQLLIPVRASGFLEVGQELMIRYDAFPYQKYGLQRGKLVRVSDSVVPGDEQSLLPLASGEPVFRANAHPSRTSIAIRGERHELKAGMTFSADIVLEQRSLLQWLLEPLISVRGKLL